MTEQNPSPNQPTAGNGDEPSQIKPTFGVILFMVAGSPRIQALEPDNGVERVGTRPEVIGLLAAVSSILHAQNVAEIVLASQANQPKIVAPRAGFRFPGGRH